MVTYIWVAGVGGVLCLAHGSENSGREIGLQAASGGKWKTNSNSHDRDSDICEIHTAL